MPNGPVHADPVKVGLSEVGGSGFERVFERP